MEHIRQYHCLIIPHMDTELVLEGPVSPAHLRTLVMHKDLDAFRPPGEQCEALVEIAELPEGRIILSRTGNRIVEYVTFHYPDEIERWSQGNMPDLIELDAIEVADDYRGLGLGKNMIATDDPGNLLISGQLPYGSNRQASAPFVWNCSTASVFNNDALLKAVIIDESSSFHI